MKMRTVAVMLGAIGAFAVATSASANTALDPSFTSGFSSDYSQVTSPQPYGGMGQGQWVAGTYAIDYNPFSEHSLWTSFTAPNGGLMMTVNGAAGITSDDPYSTVPILAQVWDIPIAVGSYSFAAWEANNYYSSYAVNPAVLQLEVNGNTVSSFSNPLAAGNWEEWTANFTVTSAGTLSIVDVEGQANGNDFSLASVPDGGLTIALLGGALVGLQALRRKLFV